MGIFSSGPSKEPEKPLAPKASTSTTPPPVSEARIPDLQLKEVYRSEKPVQDVNGGEVPKIETCGTWGEYTIILLKGDRQIKIFDGNGKKVEDFQPLSDKNPQFNFEKMLSQIPTGKKNFHFRGGVDLGDIILDELTSALAALIKKEIGIRGEDFVSIKTTFSALKGKNIEVKDGYLLSLACNGKYVVFFRHPNSSFISFQTQNEKGTPLKPANWIRRDSGSEWLKSQLPPDLREYINSCSNSVNSTLRTLNDSYTAKIGAGQISLQAKNTPNTDCFTDKIIGIEDNVCTDIGDQKVMYYCSSQSPHYLMRLDTTGDPTLWQTEQVNFPKKYSHVKSLKLDPSGNFFLFTSERGPIILAKDTMEEIPCASKDELLNIAPDGKIRAIGKDGHLVVYETNFDQVTKALDQRKAAAALQGISFIGRFQKQVSHAGTAPSAPSAKVYDAFIRVRSDLTGVVSNALSTVSTLDEIAGVRDGLVKTQKDLLAKGLKPDQVDFIMSEAKVALQRKETELAKAQVNQMLGNFHTRLAGKLSLATASDLKGELGKIEALGSFVDEKDRKAIQSVVDEFNTQFTALLQRDVEVMDRYMADFLLGVERRLESLTKLEEFREWDEYDYPPLVESLKIARRNCPPEVSRAYQKIIDTQKSLEAIALKHKKKFEKDYADHRTAAVERKEAEIDLLEKEIEGVIARLEEKNFKIGAEAQAYLQRNPRRETLERDLLALQGEFPEVAKALTLKLKSNLANALGRIERQEGTHVDKKTGQQKELIGKILVNRFEARVKEKGERTADLVFIPNDRSKGPGVKAADVMGDIGFEITNSYSKKQTVRLYEGLDRENDRSGGSFTLRGTPSGASYLSQGEYTTLKQAYREWSKGKQSKVQQELRALREKISAHASNKKRNPPYLGSEDRNEFKSSKDTWLQTPVGKLWQQEHQELLRTYGDFCAEHHVLLLQRMDEIKNSPEEANGNGKGYVPEWQSHWVMDSTTEQYLEKMAESLNMQEELQEGALMLKGHAGTGKDVLIKMYCERTHRPYFAFDCSKWTTEFELSEDIRLDAKDGASFVVKDPSLILQAIQTPGAVLYFNEFNAMTHQAQLFLHALMDEKRTLTLKTSSGKSVKADPSVLIAASMNPGYPGTDAPGFATRGRMDEIEVRYPELLAKPEASDPNRNPVYSASEALRIARGTASLSDLTYNTNFSKNDFVKLWDHYVNGIDNGAPEPSSVQRFDIDVILALVQFGTKLRENFIAKMGKGEKAKKALPVTQPFTAREMRRCAWGLNKMKDEEKITGQEDKVAKTLIERYYFCHIDKSDELEAIRLAMNGGRVGEASWGLERRAA